MTSYRIVCTTLHYADDHRHITKAGTGTNPDRADLQWTVDRVRSAIDEGDSFFTTDEAGNTASVEHYTCGCGFETIRSSANASAANDLDNLRQCNWK